MKKTLKTSKGFTLIELLIAVLILGFVLTGLIQVFIQCSVLTDLAHNKTTVMSEAQGKMEEIRNHTFDSVVTDYASGGSEGNTFSLSQLNGMGTIYIDDTNPDLLEVKIVVSWENKDGRIIGGDLDLDGDFDSGEYVNGEGEFESIGTLMTLIASR